VSVRYQYDGYTSDELAPLISAPRLELLDITTSTQDVAHALAQDGAPAGTVVLADQQTRGRGRGGSTWSSPPGWGIWLTLIERPRDITTLEVLSLRVGMRAARALDLFAPEPIRLKWPNDLFIGDRKVGGILVEARWRNQEPDWVAIGVGINVHPPQDIPRAAGLEHGTRRTEVLEHLIPELGKAVARTGPLLGAELAEFAARDMARGRTCLQPAHGTVQGIAENGELLVALSDTVVRFRTGSLVLEEF
jgi:BirA family biotin operon repressor/biotin-[acetyl-CoA-carboxylase] ligase